MKTIFILDDDKKDLKRYETHLESKYHIYTFFAAERFFAALTLIKPDVIICDLCMPFVSGPEVIARLKDEYPTIPIIIATGLTGGEHEIAARHKGCGYYAKTTPLQKLEAEICRITTTI